MKVLVTGGAGFIGSHTCEALVKAGHQVRILDCLDPQIHGENASFPSYLTNSNSIECIYGDVCSLNDCLSALDKIDIVIHLAARTGVGQSMYNFSDYVKTNIHGTVTLLEAIIKSEIPLKRFVLASSRAVYGEGMYACDIHGDIHPEIRNSQRMQQGNFDMLCPHCGSRMQTKPTSEKCDTTPLSIYALTKLHQENYCRLVAKTYTLPLVILRYFNVFGSRQSLKNPYTGVVSIFYSLLKANHALSMYEKGLPLRDFVHVKDVVHANLLAINKEAIVGEVFNIGSGSAISILSIAKTLSEELDILPNIKDEGEFRVGDIFSCYADLTKSNNLLGYFPTISLKEGIKEFSNWAQHEQYQDLYHQTVNELTQYGLFGHARSIPKN